MDIHRDAVLPEQCEAVLPDVGIEQEVSVTTDISSMEDQTVLDNIVHDKADSEVDSLLTNDFLPDGATFDMQTADLPDSNVGTEKDLRSIEKLDRSSPELWPQDLTSAARHIRAKQRSKNGEPEKPTAPWTQGLDPEDINLLHQFGSLTSSSLIEEVKKLQNIAHQLDLEEAKEITRGKLLHVLDLPTNTSNV